jgi:hypothetical protein
LKEAAEKDGDRQAQANAQPDGHATDVVAHRRAVPLADRLPWRRGGCGPGGDVGGKGGQFGVGPRGERLAQPGVEFVFVQPAVGERVRSR